MPAEEAADEAAGEPGGPAGGEARHRRPRHGPPAPNLPQIEDVRAAVVPQLAAQLRQRPPVVVMDAGRGLVAEHEAGGEQAMEEVEVAGAGGRGAGVEIGIEAAHRRQGPPPEGHVRSHSHRLCPQQVRRLQNSRIEEPRGIPLVHAVAVGLEEPLGRRLQ